MTPIHWLLTKSTLSTVRIACLFLVLTILFGLIGLNRPTAHRVLSAELSTASQAIAGEKTVATIIDEPSSSLFGNEESRVRSYVIELESPTVSEVYAESLAQQVSAASVASITQAHLATVEAEQQVLASALVALNVSELYRTQRVFNGIAVRATADQLTQIATLTNVKAIYPLVAKVPHHSKSLPVIGAPDLWQGLYSSKLTGEGVTIAIIDTGIDYFHSDFGGPGDTTLYTSTNPNVITDTLFFPSSKVIGGFDFAGDSYDADPKNSSYQPIPHPDPDPLDCYVGHGTHVAGTVAGSGVLSGGATYIGDYNNALDLSTFVVAPGVAPKAQLYALKVFGCQGSSEVTDLAIEWAVDPNQDGDLSDHVDVLNMSLGSGYGAQIDVSTIASNNAVAAGVIVVASAGNDGDVHFITGSPAVAERAISVAASCTHDPESTDLLASFSSRGPRRGDALLKPEVSAPGCNINSAQFNSGSKVGVKSGTSMAAPHVTGSMALLRQLHPDWSVAELKALVMNTAMPAVRTSAPLTASLHSPARIGAGRIDLRAAVTNTLLAFDVERPNLVSLSFGVFEVIMPTTVTRTLALVNKGLNAITLTVDYRGRVDLPGAEVMLPQSEVSVAAQSSVTVPVLLTLDPLLLKHSLDETLNDRNTRFWLSEESGQIYVTPQSGEAAIHVPLYAAARPASDLSLITTTFDFGATAPASGTLPLTGTALAGSTAPTDVISLISVFELRYSSPNEERPLDPLIERIAIGTYDSADLKYIGLATNFSGTLDVSASTLYFAIASHADWSSPNEVEFSIFVDTNGDSIFDYRIYNSDRLNALNDNFNTDSFIVAKDSLPNVSKGTSLSVLNGVAAGVLDTAIFNSNVMILPVPAKSIGLTGTKSSFTFQVESKIAEISGIIDRSPLLSWDARYPAFTTSDSNTPIVRVATAESNIPFSFDAVHAIGDLAHLLIFHHHNGAGQRAQLSEVRSAIPRTYLPLIAR